MTTMTLAAPAVRPAAADPTYGARTTRRPLSPLTRRLSLAVVLLGVAVLYLVGLGASGYANSFYSAAAQAGSQSWKAWFFGSLDASNAITVDKPPAALWVMGLSVRLFGLSSWSILVPEALMGVLTAWVLYGTVRRALLNRGTGSERVAHTAGLFAAAAMALTPAATLMFRFNNPDALLVLLVTCAAYCTVRAMERGATRWLLLAAVAIGFGFLTKMLQAFLILPVLAVVFYACAPGGWKRRLRQLLLAALAVVLSGGWYVAVVELMPASWRPYIGGSQHNSLLELIFGYNGFGRIDGQETGSVTGGMRGAGSQAGGFGGQAGGGGMWGQTGLTRMFDGVSGGMVSWLIPAALILTAVGLVVLGRRRARTDLTRAALLLAAGWMLITAAVFSFMAGIYHDYYTVALAPAIAATVALGAAVLWQRRSSLLARIGLAAALVATAAWSFTLVQQAGGIYVTVGAVAAIAMVLAAVGLLFAHRLRRLVAGLVVVVAALGALAAPASYAVDTAATPHQGSIVTAGPVQQRGMGGRAGGRFGGGANGQGFPGGQPPTGTNGQGFPGFGAPGQGGPNGQAGQSGSGTTRSRTRGGAGQGGMGAGGMGGMLDGMQVNAQLTAALKADAGHYTWAAASVGSQTAASLQLASGQPVMAIGGFNGSDPFPTLQQFQSDVTSGAIHYFVAGGRMGGQQNGGSDVAAQITSWVEAHYQATTIGGTTVYDLTQPTGN